MVNLIQRRKRIILPIFLASIFLFLISGCLLETDSAPSISPAQAKASAITVPYDSLMRNNELYVGKIVHFKGRIVQVSEISATRYVLRIATEMQPYLGYSEGIIWVNYHGNRVLEDDIIEIYGQVKGLQSYKAILGNQITIPEVDNIYLELISKGGEVQ